MARLIGLDTNILARYYVESEDEDDATLRQRKLSRKLIESGKPLCVTNTVLLEFEWVLRGYYKLSREDVCNVFQHLFSLEHIQFEDREVVDRAYGSFLAGLDFADALHHASYAACQTLASFDDRGFARKAKKLSLIPGVVLPR